MNIEEIMVKSLILSEIIKALKAAPMTEQDKKIEHQRLISGLGETSVENCWKLLRKE